MDIPDTASPTVAQIAVAWNIAYTTVGTTFRSHEDGEERRAKLTAAFIKTLNAVQAQKEEVE